MEWLEAQWFTHKTSLKSSSLYLLAKIGADTPK